MNKIEHKHVISYIISSEMDDYGTKFIWFLIFYEI